MPVEKCAQIPPISDGSQAVAPAVQAGARPAVGPQVGPQPPFWGAQNRVADMAVEAPPLHGHSRGALAHGLHKNSASVPLLRPPPTVVELHNQALMWVQWANGPWGTPPAPAPPSWAGRGALQPSGATRAETPQGAQGPQTQGLGLHVWASLAVLCNKLMCVHLELKHSMMN